MRSYRQRYWLILSGLLLGLTLFYCFGGLDFRQTLQVAYQDILVPLDPGTQDEYTHYGNLTVKVKGPWIWWTRYEHQKKNEKIILWSGTAENTWTNRLAAYTYNLDCFGDEDFFRKPLRLCPEDARLSNWVKLEIFTNKDKPELRTVFLDFWRPFNFFQARDWLLLFFRCLLIGYILWGVWFFLAGITFSNNRLGFNWTPQNWTELYFKAVWLTIIIRLVMAYLVFGSTFDMQAWIHDGEAARQHLNIYNSGVLFNYTPLLLWYCGLVRNFCDFSGYAYTLVFRFVIIAAELLTLVIILRSMQIRQGDRQLAWRGSLFYALHPVILAVFLHGQVDSLALLGIIAAWYFLYRDFSVKPRWSQVVLAGLCLGLGLAVKFYVLLILPFFIWQIKKFNQQVVLTLITGSVFAAIILFYGHPLKTLQVLLDYTGGQCGSWGISLGPAIMQTINYACEKVRMLPNWNTNVVFTLIIKFICGKAQTLPIFHADGFFAFANFKLGFFKLYLWPGVIGLALIYMTMLNKLTPLKAWLLICLSYFALGQNAALQYLSWPVAVGIIAASLEPKRWLWLKRYSWMAGLVYLASLWGDRNLLKPFIGISYYPPWSFTVLLVKVLCVPLWLYCCYWCWQELRLAWQSKILLK